MTLTNVARIQFVRNVNFEEKVAHTSQQAEIVPTVRLKQKEGAARCRIAFRSFEEWNGARRGGEKMEKYEMMKSRERYVRLFQGW